MTVATSQRPANKVNSSTMQGEIRALNNRQRNINATASGSSLSGKGRAKIVTLLFFVCLISINYLCIDGKN